ncbi:hypothetical protein PQC16_gp177 [Rhizobium phage RHph_TM30]|uniref:Uncharacterized protein n=1 Tax=Rhizobium phage RHph_TM30 TaxID=2509764 RepID=A0A7S5RES4_9CAUD|nr:hypothetical protein PQC16_gp177 [Rhizobium phage RHph_TM30]QIG71284.1 hypothetical protein EVB93_177 [Rhizobium phage RHph_TM30]QIG72010.1 hypothetical protein EVB95_176 [Rhizobium phage RHph_TM2_3B]QIG72373.1 hypothetical protein EVB96_177 [Rhizobium phage RHph_TM3_3_6]
MPTEIVDGKIDGIDINDPHFTLKHMYRIIPESEASQGYIDRMLSFFTEHPYIPEQDSYTKYEFANVLTKHDHRFEMTGYHFNPDEEFSNLTVEDDEKAILKPYALMLACLQGNAFPDLIEQYMKDAKYMLMSNGWWDKVRQA